MPGMMFSAPAANFFKSYVDAHFAVGILPNRHHITHSAVLIFQAQEG
jgi:hypothetical protein